METIEATKSEIEKSYVERHGEGYYEVDESYDKRVYENTAKNYFIIIIVLIAFWSFQAIHWWACFSFGIPFATLFMIYSIVIFVCSLFFGVWMLISGAFSNKLKREHEFWL